MNTLLVNVRGTPFSANTTFDFRLSVPAVTFIWSEQVQRIGRMRRTDVQYPPQHTMGIPQPSLPPILRPLDRN